ncbi:hypothetical protein GLAREA_04544 [Glarea lozoyensis ATCC 20868]|uniref:Uncharacterized protein n=1 Tax=Glarea lozoyensis (strain ATCC 20868 / MF5171) TaxID=1116229 RepID=S3DMN0_GLAL2|nr:uncharacterized protein GLAREA_04544 [Glarea lozoyensis ATCC 20868]EPE27753.1 hypothetical protein GLAREA_04544 [Glarea lozoyensis ATCC 20868]
MFGETRVWSKVGFADAADERYLDYYRTQNSGPEAHPTKRSSLSLTTSNPEISQFATGRPGVKKDWLPMGCKLLTKLCPGYAVSWKGATTGASTSGLNSPRTLTACAEKLEIS